VHKSSLAVLALIAVVSGCSRSGAAAAVDSPDFLADLAREIIARPAAASPVRVSVDVIATAYSERLRCTLTNISSDLLRVKTESLPCAGWWSLRVVPLTTDRRLLPVVPPVGSRISPERPSEITIEPGKTVTGEMDLANVYRDDGHSRSTNVLLLWSYSLDHHDLSTGIAALPRARR